MSEKPNEASRVYKFGAFVLNARERLLIRDEIPVQLAPKAFDLLLVLLDNNGSLMTKEVLFELVWPEATVEEGNIPYNISLVRKALGDSATDPLYIATVSKQGYRFIAPVTISPTSQSDEKVVTDRADIEMVNGVDELNAKVHSEGERDYSPFRKHLGHLLGACVLYALYYSVAFILETAYQYETYGSRALRLVPFIIFLDPDHVFGWS